MKKLILTSATLLFLGASMIAQDANKSTKCEKKCDSKECPKDCSKDKACKKKCCSGEGADAKCSKDAKSCKHEKGEEKK